MDSLPPAAAEWMKERLQALIGEHDLKPHHSVIEMSRIVLALGAQGNVRTRTLKAFPESAYREIINSLG